MGIKILLFSTYIFFIIFWMICTQWAKDHAPIHSVIGALVSGFSSFSFFCGGLLVVGLVSALIRFGLPSIKTLIP